MTRSTMFSALAAALALCATAAPVQAREEIGTMTVKLQGIDLGSETGAAIALRRIKSASVAFCNGGVPARELHALAYSRKCVRQMTDAAVDKLDAPQVTARHRGSGSVQFAARAR